MKLDDAKQLATGLMAEHGLRGWRFQFDHAKRRFGFCSHRGLLISLSAILTEANSEADVRDTILHEIAHALCGPRNGHNAKWRQTAQAIGCNGRRCYDTENVITPPPQWLGTCPHCQRRITRHRRNPRLACGQGCAGQYKRQFRFQWTPNPAA